MTEFERSQLELVQSALASCPVSEIDFDFAALLRWLNSRNPDVTLAIPFIDQSLAYELAVRLVERDVREKSFIAFDLPAASFQTRVEKFDFSEPAEADRLDEQFGFGCGYCLFNSELSFLWIDWFQDYSYLFSTGEMFAILFDRSFLTEYANATARFRYSLGGSDGSETRINELDDVIQSLNHIGAGRRR